MNYSIWMIVFIASILIYSVNAATISVVELPDGTIVPGNNETTIRDCGIYREPMTKGEIIGCGAVIFLLIPAIILFNNWRD